MAAMSHPGRVGVECRSCGAELQEVRAGGASILRCPWAPLPFQIEAGEVSCGRPYGAPKHRDAAAEYARENSGRAS